MSKIIIALHSLSVLIGCLCIAVLGLTTDSIVISHRIDSLIPRNTKGTGIGILMWAGCGGVVDMLLFLVLLLLRPLRKDSKTIPSTLYQNIVLFLATFIFLRPLIILIYTFVEYNGSIKNAAYERAGYLTSESWACYVGNGSDAQSLCDELRAARYLLIPILVLAAGMPTIVLWIRMKMSGQIAGNARYRSWSIPGSRNSQ